MQTLPPSLRALASEPVVLAARRVAAGRGCHLVGGVLRDRFLGLDSPDYDLVIADDGLSFATDLAALLAARLVLLGGDRFSAYRLVSNGLTIDIWDRNGGSLRSDLERRDFTVNAIALDVETGLLQDPLGGLTDLAQRRLRVVGAQSIREDPLRALRLVRFGLLLPEFSVDPSTISLAREAAPEVPATAAERRREELRRITCRAPGARALDALTEVGLFPLLWSGEQTLVAEARALRRSLELCDALAEVASDLSLDRHLCFHALIGRSAAKATGTTTQSAERASDPIFRDPAGLATKREMRSVTRLLEASQGELSLGPRPFLARWGALWLEASAVAWATTPARDRNRAAAWVESLAELVASEGQQVLAPRPLLDGRTVARILDLPPGPTIGRILDLLLEAQVRGEIRDRDEAVRQLPRLMRETAH